MQTINQKKASRLVGEAVLGDQLGYFQVEVKEFVHPQGKRDICLIDMEFSRTDCDISVKYLISVNSSGEVAIIQLQYSYSTPYDE